MADQVLRLRRDQVEWRAVEGEVIALELRQGVYLSVNATGALLWELLDAGATEPALCAALEEQHGLDAASAQRDVGAFLQTLREHELLQDPAS